MAAEFDPNAFRQQMARPQGQVLAPMSVQGPVPGPSVQMPSPAQQVVAPVQAQPQQQPQPYLPQHAQQPQYAPQQPAQYQAPPPHGQPYQQPQAQAPVQQQFRPQVQPAYGQAPHMPAYDMQAHPMAHEVQEPIAKKSLFKRKKLRAATAQMTPQMDGGMNVMLADNVSGVSRLILFLGGLTVGVLGTLASIMLFSGNEAKDVSVKMNKAQISKKMESLDESSQIVLTDDMLMESQNKGQP